jgi:hypothetical protein
MSKVSVLSLLWCGLAGGWGCQSEAAEPRSPDSEAQLAGSGGAPTAGGSSGSAGSASVSGGTNSGTGGAAQGGQAGTPNGQAGSSAGGAVELPPIEECKTVPSVDRFTQWVASGEGLTEPKNGSILVKEGDEYVAKVRFVGTEWHVVPVYIANQFGVATDLSQAQGITLTYSATSELHVQLRTKSHWSGGDQYATTIPATNGQKQTRVFSLDAAEWASLFGAPALTYAESLKEGMGLVFVGNSENDVVFYGLRIDGFTPPCP